MGLFRANPPSVVPASGEPCIKGSVVREFAAFVESARGASFLRNTVSTLPNDIREGIDLERPGLGLLPSQWYSARFVHALLDAIVAGTPEPDRQPLYRAAARQAVRTMLRGIYRWLFERISTPSLYARHIQRIWDMIHTGGTRRIVMLAPGEADSIVESWPAHHPVLCELVSETTVAIFESMSCTDVHAERLECVSRGNPRCRTRITWRR